MQGAALALRIYFYAPICAQSLQWESHLLQHCASRYAMISIQYGWLLLQKGASMLQQTAYMSLQQQASSCDPARVLTISK
jgi:hypothetical protein